MVFAKKSASSNQSDSLYTAKVHSFTRGADFIIRVDKKYLSPLDNVLIIDDFLANGEAVFGMNEILRQAGARNVGVGICVEKAFQPGGDLVRKAGIPLCSLAIIDIDKDGNAFFIQK